MRSNNLCETYRRMQLNELLGAAGGLALSYAMAGPQYQDEYRNAILQGYTPEQAKAKADFVIAADISADTAAGLAGDAMTGVGGFATSMLGGEAGRRAAGDLWDRQNNKGKYDPSGNGKAWHGAGLFGDESEEWKEIKNVPSLPGDLSKLFQSRDGERAPGTKATLNGQSVVWKDGKWVNPQSGETVTGQSSTDANRPDGTKATLNGKPVVWQDGKWVGAQEDDSPSDTEDSQSDTETNNDNTDSEAGDGTQRTVDPKADTATLSDDSFRTRPGESMAQKQDRLSKIQDYKNLTPTQQWALNHPALARQVKPGHAGYNDIQKLVKMTQSDLAGQQSNNNQQQSSAQNSQQQPIRQNIQQQSNNNQQQPIRQNIQQQSNNNQQPSAAQAAYTARRAQQTRQDLVQRQSPPPKKVTSNLGTNNNLPVPPKPIKAPTQPKIQTPSITTEELLDYLLQ